MKLKVSAFLMKEGVGQNTILASDADASFVSFDLNDINYDFYWNVSHSKPKWLELFDQIEVVDTESMRSQGVQGLLVFKRRERESFALHLDMHGTL